MLNCKHTQTVTVFYDVVPCSLVGTDRRFIGLYCFHHLGDRTISTRLYITTSQKTATVMLIGLIARNLSL
jgi:hypothetical protein